MAQLLRGKPAGIQHDLSLGLRSDLFAIDEVERYGVNSLISTLAYDPVQSLLAVGTRESEIGHGQIYVFGQDRVSVVFQLPRRASVRELHFWQDRLICLDSKNELTFFSLERKKLVNSFSASGLVTALEVDSCLDFLLVGLQNGEVAVYDMERRGNAPLRLPCFWTKQNPRSRLLPVVSLALHPRDVGTLLIGYADGAVIYSFKQNKPVKFFQYNLPKFAPGGESDPALTQLARSPKLTHALWHPTGTFILTCHEDSSLVIWDPWDGRMIAARTLEDTQVDKPLPGIKRAAKSARSSRREPISGVKWCANQDADDTGILIAGGMPADLPTKGLTFWELGRTPNYSTSSWDVLARHFESPKHQTVLPTPSNAQVIDLCLLPRSSPHLAGAYEPVAVMALLGSGELLTLSFPSGYMISPTNHLHPSMSLVHPFATYASLSEVDRIRWLGLKERAAQGPPLAKGGAGGVYARKRFESRSVALVAHADGTVKIWDVGHDDEIENKSMIQVDVAGTLGRYDSVNINQLSLAGATAELGVGLQSGEVIIYRWGVNKRSDMNAPPPPPAPDSLPPRRLTNITELCHPSVREGLLPLTLLSMQSPVTALKVSDVGFVAAGFEDGSLFVIDLRGPAIIYESNISDLAGSESRGSIRKHTRHHSGRQQKGPNWPTCLEFSVMTLEGEDYSSILLHAGSKSGHLSTLKLLPAAGGRYSVALAGSVSLDDQVISISPINVETGDRASASQPAVANLRSGIKVHGAVVAVTRSGARMFKPPVSRGGHKTWDDFMCDAATVVRFEDRATALVGLFGNGTARAYSIPGLKEIGVAKAAAYLDVRKFPAASVGLSGHVLGWVGPSELGLINVWGTGKRIDEARDTLFNSELTVPARPTISNLQWVSGQQYMTPQELYLLVCGPDQSSSSSSRNLEIRSRPAGGGGGYDQSLRAGGPAAGQPAAASGQGQDTYWSSISKAVSERTQMLGSVEESMNSLAETSAGWANEASKYAETAKRKAVMGVVKSSFGL